MATTSDVQDFVLSAVRCLVDNPENIKLESIEHEGGTTLRLQVSREDVGKIIGRQGRTARSIRIILHATGLKLKRKISLDIVETDMSRG